MSPNVREILSDDFGVRVRLMSRVLDGSDNAARLWRVDTDDGAAYAVKSSRGGGSTAGALVTARLAETGVPGVLAPMVARSGAVFAEHDGLRVTVVPWVEGTRGVELPMSRRQWRAYGEVLARAHELPVTADLVEVLPRERHLPNAILATTYDVDARLQSSGAVPDGATAVAELRRVWVRHRDRVLAVAEHARRLGATLRQDDVPPVVCHSDAHLGNVIVDGPVVTVLDWDDVVLAPPERDLLVMLDGGVLIPPVTAEQVAWFAEGYGDVSADRTRLAYYQCVRALEDVVLFAVDVLDDESLSARDRAGLVEIVQGVLSPVGLVETALRNSATA